MREDPVETNQRQADTTDAPPTAVLSVSALRPTRRRIVLLVALALLTVLLLLSLGGGADAITQLATADWRWLALALVIHYSGFAVRGLRWQQLLHTLGHRLSWRYTTTLLLSGWFVSALLPARAGDLLRVGVLRLEEQKRPAIPVTDSVASIALERVLDLLALVTLGAWVGFLTLRTQLPNWVMVAYGVGIVGLFVVGVLLLVAPPLLAWLRKWSSHKLWQALIAFVVELVNALRRLFTRPVGAVIVTVESLYIWFCDALLMWLVLWAMGVITPLGSITFVALTVDIFAAIPVTPGGIGQIEAVNAALLALLPLPPFNIAVAVLLNRAISYWSFLLFSGVVTFAAGIGQLVLNPSTEGEQ